MRTRTMGEVLFEGADLLRKENADQARAIRVLRNCLIDIATDNRVPGNLRDTAKLALDKAELTL